MKHEKDVGEELGRLPKTLSASYDIIYQRIKGAASTSQSVAESALKWLLCAQRPLKTLEFIAAVSIDPEGQYTPLTVPQLLDMCCNMVVLDKGLDIFRFAHLSVREYLEGCGDYTETETHTLAVERCIDTYVSKLQPQPKAMIKQNDLFRPYATLYWPVHFQTIRSNQLVVRLKEKLRQFLFQGCNAAPSFAEWILAVEELCQLLQRNHPQKDISEAVSSSPPTPLFLACRFGLLWIMHELSSFKNFCWSQRNDSKSPGLILAARWGHKAVVKLLLEKEGVDAGSKDMDGHTPLSWAAENGHLEVVKLLLEKDGVDPDSIDNDGGTPLSWAAENGHLEMVKLLLEKEGVDPDSKDDYGLTPLSWAAENGHLEVVNLLKAATQP